MTISLPPLHASETALICIDVQKRFCGQGTFAQELPCLISNYVRAISNRGVFFVFTRTVGDPKLLPSNVKRFRDRCGFGVEPSADDPKAALCPMFMPANHIVIDKPWFDAFTSTTLNQELKARHIRSVVICGVMTDVCVDATARRAVAEGYDTIILSDLIAAPPRQQGVARSALKFFEDYYGYVVNSAELGWKSQDDRLE